MHTDVSSFQRGWVGIEEFHSIQRCPHFRVLEGFQCIQMCPHFRGGGLE